MAQAPKSLGELVKPLVPGLKRLMTVPAKAPKFSVGLDLGSRAIKIVVLGARKGREKRPLVAQSVVPLAEEQESQPQDLLMSAFSSLKLPLKSVNLSVSGQWVIMRVIQMPSMKPTELRQALPYEAQRYLPFNIQDVVLDGSFLGPAESGKVWVLLVACKRELIERRLDWLKHAGLAPDLIDVDTLALANAFLNRSDGAASPKTPALIDVGAQWTNLAVLKDGIPYLVRDIPWGMEKLTRHVADQLGLEAPAVAQQLTEPQVSPEFLQTVKLSCESLVAELQLSFDFFENQFGVPPDELFVSGGASLSSGFVEALKSHFTHPVNLWRPTPELSAQLTVAYGLALRSPDES